MFISHSWSAGRWGKTLAVCFHLNGSFAVKSALVAAAAGPMCLAASGDVNNLVSSPYLFLLAVDLPLLVFFLSFFFAHVCRCGCTSPTMWIDSLCIPQTSEALKQEAISMLPAFVKCSSEMLILWDNTYCDRLWCCMEMSLFLKKGDLRKLHIVPVWLAPWLLCTMFLDWFCARLTLPLVFFFWSGGQEGNEAPVSRWGILAEYTVLWGIILVAYLPALLPALVSGCSSGINFHLHFNASLRDHSTYVFILGQAGADRYPLSQRSSSTKPCSSSCRLLTFGLPSAALRRIARCWRRSLPGCMMGSTTPRSASFSVQMSSRLPSLALMQLFCCLQRQKSSETRQ